LDKEFLDGTPIKGSDERFRKAYFRIRFGMQKYPDRKSWPKPVNSFCPRCRAGCSRHR